MFHFLRVVDSLVYPVPDGSAYGRRAVFYTFPIFFQVADGVAHGMGIFAEKHGLVETIDISIHPFHVGIHFAVHIAETVTAIFLAVACTFVVYRAVVQPFGCVVAGLEVAAPARFVAQAPEDDARMVAVAQHHAVDAVYESWNPRRHVADALVGMVFQVGFVHGVEAVVVEHGIHFGGVGIVGCADGVDVVLLHEQDVAQHRFCGDGTSVHGVRVVPVDTFKEDALSVDIEHRAFYFNVSEAIFSGKCHFFFSFFALDDAYGV